MPDIMPVSLQNFLHCSKPEMREQITEAENEGLCGPSLLMGSRGCSNLGHAAALRMQK